MAAQGQSAAVVNQKTLLLPSRTASVTLADVHAGLLVCKLQLLASLCRRIQVKLILSVRD